LAAGFAGGAALAGAIEGAGVAQAAGSAAANTLVRAAKIARAAVNAANKVIKPVSELPLGKTFTVGETVGGVANAASQVLPKVGVAVGAVKAAEAAPEVYEKARE